MDNYDDSRVDDIIDLNAGEKCFFKLWNQHIRLYSGLGNTHMPVIVMRYVLLPYDKIIWIYVEKNS